MKRIWLTLVLLSCLYLTGSLSATEVEVKVIEYKGVEYNIPIPDEENLETQYIRAMTAYIQEMVDFEELRDAFDEYQDETEKLIASKDDVIETQEDLITIKDKRIKELEAKRGVFSIIPFVYYGRELEVNNFGIGSGFLFFDSLYLAGEIGYPFEMRFSAGWKF